MIRQARLYDVRSSSHSERFDTAFEFLKQSNDRDTRCRYPYENYHDERDIHGETVHGRWDTIGTPGLSTNVDLTRHILIPFRKSMLSADVARELVKSIMANPKNYFAAGSRFKINATIPEVLECLKKEQARKKTHPGPIELIFGHYANHTNVNQVSPDVHLVMTLLDAPAGFKAPRGESYVHLRLSTPVTVRHLGVHSGGDIRSRQAFSIQDYPLGANTQILDSRRRLDEVVEAIRSKLPNWKMKPFDSEHHLQREVHHYYNREESMTQADIYLLLVHSFPSANTTDDVVSGFAL